MLENIISIKNEESNGKVYKVVYFFGLKIKFFDTNKTITKLLNNDSKILDLKNKYAKSIITLLQEIFSPSELLCLKSENYIFIISKKFFELDKQFVSDFLSFNYLVTTEVPSLITLNTECRMYREHIARFLQGELAWKYLNRHVSIERTTVCLNQSNKVEIRREILNNKFEEISNIAEEIPEKYTQPYVAGVNLYKYLNVLSNEEQKNILEKLFIYFFSVYENKNNGKIPIFDYNPHNIIINQKGFYFIDKGLTVKQEMPKSWIIYQICISNLNRYDLYKYFLGKFCLKDEFSKFKKFEKEWNARWLKDVNSVVTPLREFDKYFSERGFMPDYNLDYIPVTGFQNRF